MEEAEGVIRKADMVSMLTGSAREKADSWVRFSAQPAWVKLISFFRGHIALSLFWQ